jgi:hypothetical protein
MDRRIEILGVACMVGLLGYFGVRGLLDKSVARMSVPELIRAYDTELEREDGKYPAAAELKRRGAKARAELIRLLDSIPAANRHGTNVTAIRQILSEELPAKESCDALERSLMREGEAEYVELAARGLTTCRATINEGSNGEFACDRDKGTEAEREFRRAEHFLESARPVDRPLFVAETADAALVAFEEARERKDSEGAKRYRDKAAQYAQEALDVPDPVHHADAIFSGNTVMGNLALSQGDVEAAKQFLLLSGNTPGPERMEGQTPDWSLARALLARGERETVCEFLHELKFLSADKLIEQWCAAIRDGKTPEFELDWLEFKYPQAAETLRKLRKK